MKFTYSSGQRPLDGYTLKRGIGRGGFGEVYFAVSDGGKEVALKLLRENAAIELRGVAHCLNLKHPNLVSLYDLRTDLNGDHWVVMEHVAGESLHTVLGRHPGGLPVELAREWFLGLARAVAYLHDHGIVHRDLKPGNIFIENGAVKVGDYGLSKALSGSQRTAQTQSVGTVHYMAPEISTGNYNKSIDLYAAGIILYEMLTGKVPFEGESAGEILMKHLTSPPNLSIVPPPFVPIISKALSKNPAQRYLSLTEMAEAVASAERGARNVERSREETTPLRPTEPPSNGSESPSPRSALNTVPRSALGELCGSLALAAVLALLATALWAAVIQTQPLGSLSTVFFLTVGASWAILVPSKFWNAPMEDSLRRRLTLMLLGAMVGAFALWADGWTLEHGVHGSKGSSVTGLLTNDVPLEPSLAEAASYLSYFAVAFVAVRWWKMTDRRRGQRFSMQPILAAGFWALLLLMLWKDLGNAAVALVMTSAIVQLVSPWEPPPPAAARRLRLRYA